MTASKTTPILPPVKCMLKCVVNAYIVQVNKKTFSMRKLVVYIGFEGNGGKGKKGLIIRENVNSPIFST